MRIVVCLTVLAVVSICWSPPSFASMQSFRSGRGVYLKLKGKNSTLRVIEADDPDSINPFCWRQAWKLGGTDADKECPPAGFVTDKMVLRATPPESTDKKDKSTLKIKNYLKPDGTTVRLVEVELMYVTEPGPDGCGNFMTQIDLRANQGLSETSRQLSQPKCMRSGTGWVDLSTVQIIEPPEAHKINTYLNSISDALGEKPVGQILASCHDPNRPLKEIAKQLNQTTADIAEVTGDCLLDKAGFKLLNFKEANRKIGKHKAFNRLYLEEQERRKNILTERATALGISVDQLTAIDALARTIYAEADRCQFQITEGPKREAKAFPGHFELVGRTIYNRAQMESRKPEKWPSTLMNVVGDPWQYSNWNNFGTNEDFKALRRTLCPKIERNRKMWAGPEEQWNDALDMVWEDAVKVATNIVLQPNEFGEEFRFKVGTETGGLKDFTSDVTLYTHAVPRNTCIYRELTEITHIDGRKIIPHPGCKPRLWEEIPKSARAPDCHFAKKRAPAAKKTVPKSIVETK